MRLLAAVELIPPEVLQFEIARIVSVTESRRRPRPRRVFPLRLGREPVQPGGRNAPCRPLPLRELEAVEDRVVPAHAVHRTARVTSELARIVAHQRLILGLCHLVSPHPKPSAQDDSRQRTFIALTVGLAVRTPHRECSRWDENHARGRLHLNRAVIPRLGCGGRCVGPQARAGRQLHVIEALPGARCVRLSQVGNILDRVNAAHRARDRQPRVELNLEVCGRLGRGPRVCRPTSQSRNQ